MGRLKLEVAEEDAVFGQNGSVGENWIMLDSRPAVVQQQMQVHRTIRDSVAWQSKAKHLFLSLVFFPFPIILIAVILPLCFPLYAKMSAAGKLLT